MQVIGLNFNEIGCPKVQLFAEKIASIPEVKEVTKEAIESLTMIASIPEVKEVKAKL